MFILQGLDFARLTSAFSQERLASYESLVGGPSVEGQLGAYLWGLELSAAFSPLLSVVEVALRNAVNAAASAQFGRADWIPIVLRHAGDRQWLAMVAKAPTLTTKSFRGTATQYNKKTHVSGTGTVKLAPWKSPAEEKFESLKNALTKKGVPHQAQNLVANAMLGFWVDLFDASFTGGSSTTDLWPSATSAVFPALGATSLESVAADLRLVLAFRNRTFHHEPIWRAGPNTTPLKAETQLTALVVKIERLIKAISPDLHSALCRTGFLPRLRWLVSLDAINAFATCTMPAPPDIDRLEEAIKGVLADSFSTPLPPSVLRPDRTVTLGAAGAPGALLVALTCPLAT
jgi:hypothetical protein